MSVEIKEVISKSDLRKFVKFPIDLYKGNPYYVPSLVLDEMGTLNPDKNPAAEFCEQKLLLAYKDNKIVGRIAAIVNHKANKIWNQNNARFGFVDFIDDVEVVDALFNAAESWARSKGFTAIQGPMGFTDLDHEGLLIEGYDRISTMSTTYSHPYYKTHIERLGYIKDADWTEFFIKVPTEMPARHKKIADIVMRKYGLKVLKFENLKQIRPYVYKLFNLLNEAYKPLYGFVELTQKQIDYYVSMYVPLLRWDIVTIVVEEESDRVVGFGIAVPNLSKALQKSKGRLFPLGWAHLLKDLKFQNDVGDLMLMGIAPDYQGKGVNAIIFVDFVISVAKCGIKYLESNPELEMNNKMVSLWDGFDAENHKRRRAFIKDLS